jgi:hypothetical protein
MGFCSTNNKAAQKKAGWQKLIQVSLRNTELQTSSIGTSHQKRTLNHEGARGVHRATTKQIR